MNIHYCYMSEIICQRPNGAAWESTGAGPIGENRRRLKILGFSFTMAKRSINMFGDITPEKN